MRPTIASLAMATVANLFASCREPTMTTTDDNKAFIKEMLGSKKQLTDYPDRRRRGTGRAGSSRWITAVL
jgi:hypothetical protein